VKKDLLVNEWLMEHVPYDLAGGCSHYPLNDSNKITSEQYINELERSPQPAENKPFSQSPAGRLTNQPDQPGN